MRQLREIREGIKIEEGIKEVLNLITCQTIQMEICGKWIKQELKWNKMGIKNLIFDHFSVCLSSRWFCRIYIYDSEYGQLLNIVADLTLK